MLGGRLACAALVPGLSLMFGCGTAAGLHADAAGPTPRLWEPSIDGPPAPKLTAAPARPEQVGGLGVLSFNMHHRDRPEELAVMAEYLREVEGRPDFILCQEVLFERSRWRGRDNTAAELAAELGYHCRGSKRIENREGVAIISRYPFDFYDERHLEARTSSLLMDVRRVSAMGEFDVPGIGRVRVITTHLAYLPFAGRVRRRQMDETLAWIAERERRVPAAVTILGGDFNARPGARELAGLANPLITGSLPYLDLNTNAPTFGGRGRAYKRVDYIFVAGDGQEIRLAREKLLFRDGLWHRDGSQRFWLSDHLPVLHEYVVGPPALAIGR